jgi:tartrate dehydratase beta subunit/fumarate hydratase class I family protein
MVILLSAPLSRQAVADLRAGDAVALSGSILVLNLETAAPGVPIDAWLPTACNVGEGWVCCLAVAPVDVAPRPWSVARFDESAADRVACALLAAGSRGLVCRGRCPATTSYALRKYGGVCFGASAHWPEAGDIQNAAIANTRDDRRSAIVLTIQGARLVVTHDVHGRQVATDA